MKKILSVLAIASVMMACNNSASTEAQVAQAKQATLDSINRVQSAQQLADAERQHVIDSMNLIAANTKPRVIEHTTVRTESRNSGYSSNNGSSNNGNSNAAAPTTTSSSSSTTTTTTKKKGWTGAEKGALIGAGAGAITGAMVDKKKGEGAIVGGLLGAGGGAGVGALLEKRKKNKEAAAAAEANK